MSDLKTKYKYIRFEYRKRILDKLEDNYWLCINNKGIELGCVLYYAKWKEWEFAPYEGMGFTVECLREIADFISQLNKRSKGNNG